MDYSFTDWTICNIMSKDGTAVLILASGNSNLYTQYWSLLSLLEMGNKDIWPGSFLACPMLRKKFSMSRSLNFCRKGIWDKNLPSLASDTGLWFQMTLFMVNRGLKSGMSPRAAPAPTLHAKLQGKENHAGNTTFTCSPQGQLTSLGGGPRGSALLWFFSVSEFFCGGWGGVVVVLFRFLMKALPSKARMI